MPLAAQTAAERTELVAAGPHGAAAADLAQGGPSELGIDNGDGDATTSDDSTAAGPWTRHRKKLVIALGATAGVGLIAAGIVWGLHSNNPSTNTPVGVLPVTGQTPTDPGGGLVSGDKPADPQGSTSPQLERDAGPLPPPDAAPPAPLPPDPYANDPGLNAPPPPPPAPLPKSQAGTDGLPPDTLPDDLGNPSQSGASGLEDPSYGPTGSPGATPPQYRTDPRRYGPTGYRNQDRPNGPLGSLREPNDRNRGPRRGPVDDTVPGLGGLGGR